MLAIIRVFLIVLSSILICFFGIFLCFFRPGNPNHTATIGRLFGKISYILGIKIEIRFPKINLPKNCVYISNHQNNYDMIIASSAVQPRTVTVGKRNLLWIPIFGFLYWITGNILINRKNHIHSYKKLKNLSRKIRKQNMSVWIFPEGTRNKGNGLLPFKIGAFFFAVKSGIPIVPVCISDTNEKINLNRWYNGLVIIEILPPISTEGYNHTKKIKELRSYCREIIKKKIERINQEVISRENTKNF